MPSDEAGVLASIDRKLGVLIGLAAYTNVKGMTVAQGAPILRRLGLSQAEIAAVFDTTANSVSVRLAEAKRKPLKKSQK
ncbi:MAG: sigma-70 family RNA polymerase sigma factor [Planctomycetes bacterium]|nr:sigma-70 family RNA polymerase sigma factor [Planctomycetota bacterium]